MTAAATARLHSQPLRHGAKTSRWTQSDPFGVNHNLRYLEVPAGNPEASQSSDFDPLEISLLKIHQVNSMSLDIKNVRANSEKLKIAGQSLRYLVHFISVSRQGAVQ